ncbi:AEC family transporter [Chloroflexota bacterium]
MDIFIVVLESVLVLLGIGVIGFWVAKREIIPEKVLGFLSQLAIDIALPCTVFASIMINFSPARYPDWWQLPLWWLLFTSVALVLTLITSYISNKDTRAEFRLGLFYQNGIFFPLIILSGIFGTNTPFIAQLFIFIILHPTMYFSTYNLFFKKAGGAVKWKRVLNPVLIATFIAIAIQLVGVKDYLPEFIVSIFQILGGMALPLVMLILGGSLYLDFQQKGKFYYGEIIKLLLIKNILFPLVFLGILILLQPDYNIALLFILQSAVPPVTGIPIVTERAGGNKSIATQFVFSSFVFSMISIPATFHLFSYFFPMP